MNNKESAHENAKMASFHTYQPHKRALMDDQHRIAKLEAEVAVLHMFAISLIDALPGDVATTTRVEFTSNYETLRASLIAAQRPVSAEDLDAAVEALNSRSISHLRR